MILAARRATHISKTLVSHQSRCNFIFSSCSSSVRPLSLWPASLHTNNGTKWDRVREVCWFFFSSLMFLCSSVRLALGWVTGWPQPRACPSRKERKERKKYYFLSFSNSCYPDVKYLCPFSLFTSSASNWTVILFIKWIWAAAQTSINCSCWK